MSKLQQWIHNMKPGFTRAKYAVRTSVMTDLRIRVRVELVARLGETAPGVEDLFIGPFKDVEEAEREGRNIAKLVRTALGQEKN